MSELGIPSGPGIYTLILDIAQDVERGGMLRDERAVVVAPVLLELRQRHARFAAKNKCQSNHIFLLSNGERSERDA